MSRYIRYLDKTYCQEQRCEALSLIFRTIVLRGCIHCRDLWYLMQSRHRIDTEIVNGNIGFLEHQKMIQKQTSNCRWGTEYILRRTRRE